MIEGYLNQRAVWKRVVRLNEYGEPVTKQKKIKVRWEGKRRLVRDNQGREVGRHRGIAHFTIGQRRGLDVAMGEPYYVTHLDPATNTVTIGPAEDLLADRLRASKVNWLVDPPADPFRAVVKIRYAHAGAPAAVRPLSADCVEVHFDEPVRAITPGQAAVFYDGDFVLGGGWIE